MFISSLESGVREMDREVSGYSISRCPRKTALSENTLFCIQRNLELCVFRLCSQSMMLWDWRTTSLCCRHCLKTWPTMMRPWGSSAWSRTTNLWWGNLSLAYWTTKFVASSAEGATVQVQLKCRNMASLFCWCLILSQTVFCLLSFWHFVFWGITRVLYPVKEHVVRRGINNQRDTKTLIPTQKPQRVSLHTNTSMEKTQEGRPYRNSMVHLEICLLSSRPVHAGTGTSVTQEFLQGGIDLDFKILPNSFKPHSPPSSDTGTNQISSGSGQAGESGYAAT